MKTLVKHLMWLLGFEIRRRSMGSHECTGPDRGSIEGSLRQVCNQGFMPETVIDVGAALGTFSLSCHTVFPNAQYVLVEPLEEYIPSLRKVTHAIARASYDIAVASTTGGTASLNVHHDLVGSSLFQEMEEGTEVNGVQREVPSVTLDHLVVEKKARPPYLLKIDVQGAELNVLLGGKTTLKGTEYVVLEVSCFEFFQHGPQFGEVVAFMESNGFVPYDIFGLQYRPLDNALSQVDVVFVKKTGRFRKYHYYATPAQRQEQNHKFRSHLNKVLSRNQAA